MSKSIGIHTANSLNKDTAYVAMVILFNNIGDMCVNKISGWELAETHTDCQKRHYLTKYSNGKMFIKAESVGDYHVYTMGDNDDIN